MKIVPERALALTVTTLPVMQTVSPTCFEASVNGMQPFAGLGAGDCTGEDCDGTDCIEDVSAGVADGFCAGVGAAFCSARNSIAAANMLRLYCNWSDYFSSNAL